MRTLKLTLTQSSSHSPWWARSSAQQSSPQLGRSSKPASSSRPAIQQTQQAAAQRPSKAPRHHRSCSPRRCPTPTQTPRKRCRPPCQSTRARPATQTPCAPLARQRCTRSAPCAAQQHSSSSTPCSARSSPPHCSQQARRSSKPASSSRPAIQQTQQAEARRPTAALHRRRSCIPPRCQTPTQTPRNRSPPPCQ